MCVADKIILDKKDREFFRIVAKAAFSNPFGAESLELNCKIAEGRYDAGDILNRKIVANVRQRLKNIST